MSLLEAVVATVILALVGVACLEGTQRALVLQARAEQRTLALQQAESELAAVTLRADEVESTSPSGRARLPQRVARAPYQPAWAESTPLPVERVTVRVETDGGRVMQLTRLVPRARSLPPASALAASSVQP